MGRDVQVRDGFGATSPEWYPAGLFGAYISRSPKQNRSNICLACHGKQDKNIISRAPCRRLCSRDRQPRSCNISVTLSYEEQFDLTQRAARLCVISILSIFTLVDGLPPHIGSIFQLWADKCLVSQLSDGLICGIDISFNKAKGFICS